MEIYTGDDGETAYLVTKYDDGSVEIAMRDVTGGTRQRWSPPVALTAADAH